MAYQYEDDDENDFSTGFLGSSGSSDFFGGDVLEEDDMSGGDFFGDAYGYEEDVGDQYVEEVQPEEYVEDVAPEDIVAEDDIIQEEPIDDVAPEEPVDVPYDSVLDDFEYEIPDNTYDDANYEPNYEKWFDKRTAEAPEVADVSNTVIDPIDQKPKEPFKLPGERPGDVPWKKQIDMLKPPVGGVINQRRLEQLRAENQDPRIPYITDERTGARTSKKTGQRFGGPLTAKQVGDHVQWLYGIDEGGEKNVGQGGVAGVKPLVGQGVQRQGGEEKIPFKFEVEVDPATGQKRIKNLDVGGPTIINGKEVLNPNQGVPIDTPERRAEKLRSLGINEGNQGGVKWPNNLKTKQADSGRAGADGKIDMNGLLTPQLVNEFKKKGYTAQDVAEELDTRYRNTLPATEAGGLQRFFIKEDFDKAVTAGNANLRAADVYELIDKKKLMDLGFSDRDNPNKGTGLSGGEPKIPDVRERFLNQNNPDNRVSTTYDTLTPAQRRVIDNLSSPVSSRQTAEGNTIESYRFSTPYSEKKHDPSKEFEWDDIVRKGLSIDSLKNSGIFNYKQLTPEEIVRGVLEKEQDILNKSKEGFGSDGSRINHKFVLDRDAGQIDPSNKDYSKNDVYHLINSKELFKNISYADPTRDYKSFLNPDADLPFGMIGGGGDFGDTPDQGAVNDGKQVLQGHGGNVQGGNVQDIAIPQNNNAAKDPMREDALFNRIQQQMNGRVVNINGTQVALPNIADMPPDAKKGADFVGNIRTLLNNAVPNPTLQEFAESADVQKQLFDKLSDNELRLVKSFVKENTNSAGSGSSNKAFNKQEESFNAQNTGKNAGENERGGFNKWEVGRGGLAGNNWGNKLANELGQTKGIGGARGSGTEKDFNNSTNTSSVLRNTATDQALQQLSAQSETAGRVANLLLQAYDRQANERNLAIQKEIDAYSDVASAQIKASITPIKDGSKQTLDTIGRVPESGLSSDAQKIYNDTGIQIPSQTRLFSKTANSELIQAVKDNPMLNDALEKHANKLLDGQFGNNTRPSVQDFNKNPSEASAQKLIRNILHGEKESNPVAGQTFSSNEYGYAGDRRNVSSVRNFLDASSSNSGALGILNNPSEKLTEKQAAELSLTANVLDSSSYWTKQFVVLQAARPAAKGAAPQEQKFGKVPIEDAINMVHKEFMANPNSAQSRVRAMTGVELIKSYYPDEFSNLSTQAGLMQAIWGVVPPGDKIADIISNRKFDTMKMKQDEKIRKMYSRPYGGT